MENTQNTKTASESEPKADTSEDLTKLPKKASTDKGASRVFPSHITATTLNASKKTLKKVDLEVLRSKAGLVAGAIQDFQDAGGLVVLKNMEYEGGKFVKINLVAEGFDLVANHTTDGIDFFVTPFEAK